MTKRLIEVTAPAPWKVKQVVGQTKLNRSPGLQFTFQEISEAIWLEQEREWQDERAGPPRDWMSDFQQLAPELVAKLPSIPIPVEFPKLQREFSDLSLGPISGLRRISTTTSPGDRIRTSELEILLRVPGGFVFGFAMAQTAKRLLDPSLDAIYISLRIAETT